MQLGRRLRFPTASEGPPQRLTTAHAAIEDMTPVPPAGGVYTARKAEPMLRPFFGFYGGKWRDALKHYLRPPTTSSWSHSQDRLATPCAIPTAR